MKTTYGVMLVTAACMASGMLVSGCAGPSTRVLPRESSSAYEAVPEGIPVLEEVNPFYLQEELGILTASQRSSGSRGESDAARYMQQLLRDYGYQVNRQRFRYGDPDGSFVTGTNVEAVRPAADEDADILIISTHHDSAPGSPGACDNASGVVTWLETARLVAKLPTDTELRFISVSGSWQGWIGARHYVDSLTEKERERVIGCIDIDETGYVAGGPIVLGTPDGKPTMLGDMVKESAWDMLGETCRYEVRQQKNYLAFTRGRIPSLCLTQSRDAYEAGTPLDLAGAVDVERLSQTVNVVTGTVSRIMSTDTPSMLAKSRFMNDIRDDAYLRLRDEEVGFGDTLEQTELRLGMEGRERSVNTDNAGRKIACYGYRMKWFDVDQQLLTDYYYVDGKLSSIDIDGDGAGVEFDDMRERLSTWYGEPDAESQGPSGTEYSWKDPAHRIQARLTPETDGYEVELQEYVPERKLLGTFVWDREAGCYRDDPEGAESQSDASEGVDSQPELTAKRLGILLDKVNALYAPGSAVRPERILVYTDGIGGSKGYADRKKPVEEEESQEGGEDLPKIDEDLPEIGVDLEDLLTAEGSWRSETAAELLMVKLYGELLEQEDPEKIASEYVRRFPSGPGDEAERVQTGIRPGEGADSSQELPGFGDSFALFVLTGQPEEPLGDWAGRVRYFYGYKEMKAYRDQVRKNLKLQMSWTQEAYTAEEP